MDVVVLLAGAKVTEETTLPAALLMNLIFLCGLFTFAVVLGFVSEEIKSQLRSVKAGNYAGTPLLQPLSPHPMPPCSSHCHLLWTVQHLPLSAQDYMQGQHRPKHPAQATWC